MSVTAVRPARLAGLNSSHKPREYISQTTKAWNAPPPPKNNSAPCCPNAKCNGTPLVRDDEGLLCPLCGQVAEDSNIVSEVQFGETAGGAAMVEGGFIGDQQRHANSMGGTMRGLGGMESREQALWNAKITIDAIGSSLLQRSQVLDQAYSWYKLASNHNFIRGRRIRNVAAVAIYMAARRQTDNTLMLMDLSEKIQTNVWELGNTYKDFLKLLGEKDPAQLADKDKRATQEIEPLMLKYCRKLEFGEDSYQVAADACKIAKRMKRDWMIEGRQPAGICGACIILAARMNNYRRTVREVVYVVKVGDSTINNRLYEYKKTPSSALTVKQFREFGQRMKVKTLPPAIWRREEKEERKEKKRARAAGVDEGEGSNAAGADPSVSDISETGANAAPTRASKRRKSNDGSSQAVTAEPGSSTVQPSQENVPATIDADALDGNAEAVLESVANAVADAETDNAGDADFVMPKKRGRQPKKRQVIEIDPDDLEIEQEIENEVAEEIINWESIFKEFAVNENHEVFQRTGWTARQLTAAHTDTRDINLSADIGEDEFEDDPDVASCILNPEEVRLKEAIWITENDDWLREQQKKMLEAELEAAQDKPKKPKQKRKHHQMGDGSVLGGQPAASAAEAAQKMLNRRAPTFSNHVNYDKLKELFGDGTAVSTPSGSGLGASPAASQNQRSPPALPVTAPIANEEDEEEEEEEEMEYEGEAYDEEEDLEHAYRDDDDEGFGNDYADDY